MKIPLSESKSSLELPLRLVGDEKFSLLLMNLLCSKNDIEYKQASIDLRDHIRPRHESSEHFKCINPDWFGDFKNDEIDRTTCVHCGYRKNCTIDIDETDYLEIVPIANARLPTVTFLHDEVLFPMNSVSRTNKDPFFGFSMRAGQTRKIYCITQNLFSGIFPNNLNSEIPLDSAIGYDMATGKAIWPIDQQFLEIYEQMDIKIRTFELPGNQGIFQGELSTIDRNCLQQIAMNNNWVSNHEGSSIIEELDLLCSRMIRVLKNRELNKFFRKIANIQMTPGIDIPYGSSGSGYFNMVMRWIELKPNDILHYISCFDGDENEREHCESISVIFNQVYREVDDGSISLYPRFPAIAIVPSAEIPNILLEQPACRIIDVIEHEGTEPILLIDSLGIDLIEVL